MDKLFKPLDNFIPRAPQISKLFSSSKGWDGWTKQIKPPQHDISRTRSLTLTFGGRGCRPILSSRFEYFVHLTVSPPQRTTSQDSAASIHIKNGHHNEVSCRILKSCPNLWMSHLFRCRWCPPKKSELPGSFPYLIPAMNSVASRPPLSLKARIISKKWKWTKWTVKWHEIISHNIIHENDRRSFGSVSCSPALSILFVQKGFGHA